MYVYLQLDVHWESVELAVRVLKTHFGLKYHSGWPKHSIGHDFRKQQNE